MEVDEEYGEKITVISHIYIYIGGSIFKMLTQIHPCDVTLQALVPRKTLQECGGYPEFRPMTTRKWVE